ncbi:MAG TPA: secondary thiamine-phosphate synthase enzyme YjbQ [Gemmatimonadota bacterium]|nr:secondary thiamine-phosphate synthase enzyme YjbQ [Gemmatimonadota bacterium]
MREIQVASRSRRELVDITRQVAAAARETGGDGAWLVFVPHTTAGVTINEGADPAVADDILMALEAVVPEDQRWKHAEGNSPAHVLSTLVGSSVVVAVEDGELALGTWQSIFLCEFDGPRSRKVWLEKLG